MIIIPKINDVERIAQLGPQAKYLYFCLLGACDSNGVCIYDPRRWATDWFSGERYVMRDVLNELKRADVVRFDGDYLMLAHYQDSLKATASTRKPKFKHPQQVKFLDNKLGYTLNDDIPAVRKDFVKVPFDDVVTAWNAVLAPRGVPAVHVSGQAQRTRFRSRWMEDEKRQSVDWWRTLFEHIAEFCPFLMGQGSSWIINFDWLLRPDNLGKVLNGNYDNGGRPALHPQGTKYRGK